MPLKSQIQQLRAFECSEEICVPFAIAGETLDLAAFTIISLTDENGLVGIGEASPFSTLTGDNIHGVTITAKEILEHLRGLTVVASMQQLRKNREEWFTASPSAFVGIEMALWDLFGKQVKLPLAAIWGQRMHESVMTDITLPIMPGDLVEGFWQRFKSYEFDVVKIKVSGNVGEDLDRVNSLLKCLPHGAQITLDGNKGYQFDDAVDLLERLKNFNIAPLFFEQPLAADDWEGLSQLEKKTGVPICLDETVVTPEDAIRVVQEKTASMINLKIMKSGIDETRRIIAIARSAGIALMIGGMLESEIAMGASLQLACGTGWISHFDLDTPFFFKRRLTIDSPWHGSNSRLHCPQGPGIGIELSPQWASASLR